MSIQKLLKSMPGLQVEEKCPILAPNVIDIKDEWGNFVVRTHNGHFFDEDGDEIFD